MTVWLWAAIARAGIPVVSVDFTVEVAGPLAEVTVEQVFVNDGDEVLEAAYVFPLHEHAAVDQMRFEVAGRIVEGEVEELQRAVAEYDEAIEKGQVAAITTQSRPNVFVQHVGNIPPGEEVRVELHIVQPVPHVDGAYELVLPLEVGPRFVPLSGGRPARKRGLRAPGPVEIEPGPMEAAKGSKLSVGIDVIVAGAMPLTWMDSPSHDLGITEITDAVRAVTGRVDPDEDFVLRWDVAAEEPTAAMVVQDGHAVLVFEPPDAPPRTEIVPRELIWVIDQSGSMGGHPIETARRAMREALRHVDARDSLRVLRFSDIVEGDAFSRAATPAVLAEARRQIESMQASGGTYLLDGVLAALDPPSDPGRERYVMFLTDGQIGEDWQTLGAIADQVGSARLFSFGIGASTNRYFLDEMARIGGGKATWIGERESAADAVQRFVDTIDKPVLTDIEIDWGDWEVRGVLPQRLPALYAGQPLLVTTQIVRQGTTDVVVRGRLGSGSFEQVLTPTDVGAGRAVPSTWARRWIGHLEAEQRWGPIEEVTAEIVATSLTYQVLSQHTAFLAVDRRQLLAEGISEEVTVEARSRSVAVESSSRGAVLTQEFMTRIPAGSSFQSMVSFASGVQTGSGGNPNIGGGAYNENTYLVDGVNITDPVTGTFSLNFNVDAIERIEVTTGAAMPELPGSLGNVINVVTESGTNNLALKAGANHLQGADTLGGLSASGATGHLTGPLVRDRVWFVGDYGYDQSQLAERAFEGHTAFSKLTWQPSPEHRLTASGHGHVAQVQDGEVNLDQAVGLGAARWQWFLAPEVNVDSSVSAQDLRVGGDQRDRLQGQVHASVLSVDDPYGGRHDLKVGADVDRASWDLGQDGAVSWLAVNVPPEAEMTRGGAFVQDRAHVTRNLVLNYGTRVDVSLGRPFVGPRLYGSWDPFGDQKTKIATGWGRAWGHLGLPTLLVDPEAGLSRLDEWILTLERELVSDLAIFGHGALRDRRGVPTLLGERIDRRSLSTTAGARKVHARRWATEVSWTYTQLEDPADVTVVDDGALEAFAHSAKGSFYWDLPTDPWTLGIGLLGRIDAVPLGTVAPDPTSAATVNAPLWSVGASAHQDLYVRKGVVTLEVEGRWVELLNDTRDLTELVGLQRAVPELAGWEGPRIYGGLRYAF